MSFIEWMGRKRERSGRKIIGFILMRYFVSVQALSRQENKRACTYIHEPTYSQEGGCLKGTQKKKKSIAGLASVWVSMFKAEKLLRCGFVWAAKYNIIDVKEKVGWNEAWRHRDKNDTDTELSRLHKNRKNSHMLMFVQFSNLGSIKFHLI